MCVCRPTNVSSRTLSFHLTTLSYGHKFTYYRLFPNSSSALVSLPSLYHKARLDNLRVTIVVSATGLRHEDSPVKATQFLDTPAACARLLRRLSPRFRVGQSGSEHERSRFIAAVRWSLNAIARKFGGSTLHAIHPILLQPALMHAFS